MADAVERIRWEQHAKVKIQVKYLEQQDLWEAVVRADGRVVERCFDDSREDVLGMAIDIACEKIGYKGDIAPGLQVSLLIPTVVA